ncbi:MAG TPA: hypothetical protein VNX00_16275, partial [Herbaspirillum sp.]|nr:hypothetical protein [Herbaspirillum sp.]
MTTPPQEPSAQVTIGPGSVLPLDRAGQIYLIRSGRCEIYALTGGRRIYLSEFGPGQTLVCSPSAHGQLIAVAPEGSSLTPMAFKAIARDALADVFDIWILALSETAGRQGMARPALRALDAGEALADMRGQNLHSLRGVVWTGRIGTAMRYLGVVAI